MVFPVELLSCCISHVCFQKNSGIQFSTSLGTRATIDISGRSPCLLSLLEEDCTFGGATFMFWMKPLDDVGAPIFTTVKDTLTGGFYVWFDASNFLHYCLIKISSTNIVYRGKVFGFLQYTNSWIHLAFVWRNSGNQMKIYTNGTEESIFPLTPGPDPTPRNKSDVMAVALGQGFVTVDGPLGPKPPKQMIVDELILCDKPLSEGEINQMMNL